MCKNRKAFSNQFEGFMFKYLFMTTVGVVNHSRLRKNRFLSEEETMDIAVHVVVSYPAIININDDSNQIQVHPT